MPAKQVVLKDVFISYSNIDRDAVERIVAKLTENNLSVFYAPADIQAGNRFISDLEEGLRTSQVVLLFLTHASLNSYWVREEWQARTVQMAADKTLRLIVALLPGVADADIPVMLATKHRLDFRSRNLAAPGDIAQIATEIVMALRQDLPAPNQTSIGVPFVVFAMTDQEAAELVSGAAFTSPRAAREDKMLFDALTGAVEYSAADLPDFYGALRDDWRPPLANPQMSLQGNAQSLPLPVTIRHNVEAIIRRINDNHFSTPSEPIVRPQFFSTDFLTDDNAWRQRTWDHLKDQGCVIIVDVFSLCHPVLRNKLRDSGFGVLDNVSLVVLSPLRGDQQPPINGIIERDISDRLQQAFYRYDCKLDLLCEFGVGNVRALNRWLYWTLPQTIKVVQGAKASPLRRMGLQMQQGRTPTGVDSLFT